MQNINRNSGDNLGGLEAFYFLPVEDLVKLPPVVNQVLAGQIEIRPGSSWYAFYCTQGSLQFTETESASRAGNRFAWQLKGFIAKDTPELSAALAGLTGRRFVLLYKDFNGHTKLAGSRQHYLTFTRELDTASSPTGRNGVAFSFKGESTAKALFYTGSFTVAGQGQVNEPQPAPAFAFVKDGEGNTLATLLPGQTLVIESGFSYGFRILT